MKALDTQIGGTHYKDMAIQPAEFNHKNNIGFLLGTAISYIAREGMKDAHLDDIKKAIHTLQMYVELEEDKEPTQLTPAATEGEWDELLPPNIELARMADIQNQIKKIRVQAEGRKYSATEDSHLNALNRELQRLSLVLSTEGVAA